MRILITGGNGFLGSSVSRHLLMLGHDVYVASRSSYRITDILDRVVFLETSDVCSTHSKDILEIKPDVIIDCAWDGGNNYAQVNSLNQFGSNISRVVGLLETIAGMNHQPRFVGFGSFSEYGMLKTKAEENQQEKPITQYGLAKATVKEMSRIFCEQNGIGWTWIRPCYVYGPNDVQTRLIPKVIDHLLNDKTLVLNSCETTIDYLHVYDFCTAIAALLDSRKDGVFNVCSGEEYRLTDVIAHIQKKLGTGKITYDKSLTRDYSSRYICGSSDKLKSETNWQPVVDLQQGILNTIESYKEIEL